MLFHKVCLLSIAAAAVISTSAAAAQVTFTNNYEADVLPNAATPAWTSGSSTFTAAPSVKDGVLTLNTGPDIFKTGYFFTTAGWNGDTTTGSTVEVKLRQVSGSGRLQLAHNNGKGSGYYYDLLISSTRIAHATAGNDLNPAEGEGLDLDMTEFHTLRLVINPGDAGAKRTVDVYVDGATTKAFSLLGYSAATTNRILIGDGASSGLGGVVEYDYVRWTNDSAAAPVPEPSAGAAAMALCGLALRHRRRRS